LPEKKETSFFVLEKDYKKGLDYYKKKYYSTNDKPKIIGEICPQYMSSSAVPKRIYDDLGNNIKIIFLLRNPVKRAYSHYCMKSRTFEDLSFNDAIDKALKVVSEKEILNKHLEFDKHSDINKSEDDKNAYRYSRYIYPGLYSTIIKDYLRYFPKENMKFIIFEEFIDDIPETINSIYDFLNIGRDDSVGFNIHSNSKKVFKNSIFKFIRNLIYLIPKTKKNKLRNLIGKKIYMNFKSRVENILTNTKTPPIPVETNEMLKTFYKPEIKELENILDRDLNIWLKEY
jgi:hypothetical protein